MWHQTLLFYSILYCSWERHLSHVVCFISYIIEAAVLKLNDQLSKGRQIASPQMSHDSLVCLVCLVWRMINSSQSVCLLYLNQLMRLARRFNLQSKLSPWWLRSVKSETWNQMVLLEMPVLAAPKAAEISRQSSSQLRLTNIGLSTNYWSTSTTTTTTTSQNKRKNLRMWRILKRDRQITSNSRMASILNTWISRFSSHLSLLRRKFRRSGDWTISLDTWLFIHPCKLGVRISKPNLLAPRCLI